MLFLPKVPNWNPFLYWMQSFHSMGVNIIISWNLSLFPFLNLYNLFFFQTSYNISDSVLVAVWSWRADSSGTWTVWSLFHWDSWLLDLWGLQYYNCDCFAQYAYCYDVKVVWNYTGNESSIICITLWSKGHKSDRPFHTNVYASCQLYIHVLSFCLLILLIFIIKRSSGKN